MVTTPISVDVEKEPKPRNLYGLVALGFVCLLFILFGIGLLGKVNESMKLNREILAYLQEKQYLAFGDGKDGKYSIAPINSVGMLKAEKELTEAEKKMICK